VSVQTQRWEDDHDDETSPPHPRAGGPQGARGQTVAEHGTLDTLFAALDTQSGQILAAEESTSNSAADFIAFLEHIDTKVPAGLDIHLMMDNGSSHVAKATAAWLAAHPRFQAHYTPPQASWLNQVELWLSILHRRLLKRGEFSSVDELIDFQHSPEQRWNRQGGMPRTPRVRSH